MPVAGQRKRRRARAKILRCRSTRDQNAGLFAAQSQNIRDFFAALPRCFCLSKTTPANTNHKRRDFAAALLQPYVSRTTHWIVKHHGIFQGYYYFHHYGKDRNAREQFRGHPAFEKTIEFCSKWDQVAFDPGYDTMPLSAFEPIVRRVFARPAWSVEGPPLPA